MRNTAFVLASSIIVGLTFVACASAPPSPAIEPAPLAPAPPPPVAVAPAETPPPPAGPPVATCVASDAAADVCFPDAAYRDWLCSEGSPAAAFDLFRKGTPFVRAYVSRDLESWDPNHRSRAGRSHLSLDEEVILLHAYKPESGVMVLGAANARGWTSVDAVRLDGSCVSLMSDEISTKRPPSPRHAPIAWEKLDGQMRDKLLASPDLRKKADQMAKTCTLASASASADGTKRCLRAKSQLTDAAVAATPSS